MLMHFAEWLKYELEIQEGGDRLDKIEEIPKAGVTNFFVTESYVMGHEPYERLPVC